MKKILAFLLIFLFSASGLIAADIEYGGYYLKRKEQVSKQNQSRTYPAKKYNATHTRNGSPLKGHTLERDPSCVMYLGVGSELEGKRWRVLVRENGKVARKPVLGVIPVDNGQRGLAFLKEIITGNYVKICHPELSPMNSESAYGLIYVEPLIDSVQEMLIDKKMGKLFNAKIEK